MRPSWKIARIAGIDPRLNLHDMTTTVQALVAPGQGILAADESTGTIAKRFQAVGAPCTAETRRAYREAIFTAPGLNDYISGIILFDETIRQNAADGTPMADLIVGRGIIPGIKVDQGIRPLAGFPGETITEGLDGLRDRLAGYARMGARFAKWRAVFTVGPQIPTRTGLDANALALARYAALCQETGLVPIVEPEVLMEGAHSLARHAEVTEEALRRVFLALADHRVCLEALLLKSNMILPGKDSPQTAGPDEVAAATLRCLRHTVPAAVPGIMFLSGGQSDLRATENLNALNRLGNVPWQLSFSYGRALQAPALQCWAGRSASLPAAQEALLHRARCNSAARFGMYSAELERPGLARTKD